MKVATFCGSCGTEIQPGVTFCGTCGAPVALSTTAAAPAGVPPEPKSEGRRSPWLLAAVGIAVVAVGGVAAVLLTRGGDKAKPASQTVVRTLPAAATRTALAAPTTTTASATDPALAAPTTTAASATDPALAAPTTTAAPASDPALAAPTTTAAPATDPALDYVDRVDTLLAESQTVVIALRAFVPQASTDAISRGEAVRLARSYLAKRKLQLAQARTLVPPPELRDSQRLLLAAFAASLADDQALVDWTVARRDGDAGAPAALDRATQLGSRASAVKAVFRRTYGRERQASTGRPPTSLPKVF
jgi:hypothetical protein